MGVSADSLAKQRSDAESLVASANQSMAELQLAKQSDKEKARARVMKNIAVMLGQMTTAVFRGWREVAKAAKEGEKRASKFKVMMTKRSLFALSR